MRTAGEIIKSKNRLKQLLNTGYDFFNDPDGALFEGAVSLLVGRPSMGKTRTALNLVRNLISQGIKVCYISLDLSADAIIERLLNLDTSSESLNNLYLSDIVYSEMSARRLTDVILNECEDLKLIVIDEIDMLGRSTLQWLKGLFPGAAVIAISKAGRECESRDEHRVKLNDIEGIEEIYPYVDNIFSLYREDYYKDISEKRSNTLEITRLKGRNGLYSGTAIFEIEPGFRLKQIFCGTEDIEVKCIKSSF